MGSGTVDANGALAILTELAAQGTAGITFLHCDIPPYGLDITAPNPNQGSSEKCGRRPHRIIR